MTMPNISEFVRKESEEQTLFRDLAETAAALETYRVEKMLANQRADVMEALIREHEAKINSLRSKIVGLAKKL